MKVIKISYRNRGKHLRINNIKKNVNNTNSLMFIKNKFIIIIIINITIPYSLKNKNTNEILPISILNPLINSLSPSIKSKGARFVSIKEIINQINNQIIYISNGQLSSLFKSKVFIDIKSNKSKKIKATSKDKLCKIPRILPSLEKELVLLKPVKITE